MPQLRQVFEKTLGGRAKCRSCGEIVTGRVREVAVYVVVAITGSLPRCTQLRTEAITEATVDAIIESSAAWRGAGFVQGPSLSAKPVLVNQICLAPPREAPHVPQGQQSCSACGRLIVESAHWKVYCIGHQLAK